LLKTTWATGAMPIGAPGWPELAWKVASTCKTRKNQQLVSYRGHRTIVRSKGATAGQLLCRWRGCSSNNKTS
jgi:hypothetical protein